MSETSQTLMNSLSSIPTLPPEILHHIFDHCTHSSLSTSSLVTRAWRHLAQSHLFSSISIQHVRLGLNTIDGFLGVLNANPTLGNWLKSLTLSVEIFSPGEVKGLLRRLPNLQCLILDSAFLNTAPPPTSTTSNQQSSQPVLKLKNLHVLYTAIVETKTPWLPLFSLIHLFDAIDVLQVCYLYVAGGSPLDQPSAPPSASYTADTNLSYPSSPFRKTRVREIGFLACPLGNSGSEAIARLALDYVDTINLSSFTLASWAGDGAGMYQTLLDNAPGLKKFTVDIIKPVPNTDRSLSLAKCPHIETIRFGVQLHHELLTRNAQQLRENINVIVGMLTSLRLATPSESPPSPMPSSSSHISDRSRNPQFHKPYELPLARIDLHIRSPYMWADCEEMAILIGIVDWASYALALEPFARSRLAVVNIKLKDHGWVGPGMRYWVDDENEDSDEGSDASGSADTRAEGRVREEQAGSSWSLLRAHIERGLEGLKGRCRINVAFKNV